MFQLVDYDGSGSSADEEEEEMDVDLPTASSSSAIQPNPSRQQNGVKTSTANGDHTIDSGSEDFFLDEDDSPETSVKNNGL
jgi:hypothetical protein